MSRTSGGKLERAHRSKTGITILSMAEVPNFLAGVLPSLMTIRRFGATKEDVDTLRIGEVIGGILSLSIGLGASIAEDTPAPFLGNLAVLAFLITAYEWAIQHPHPNAVPINQQESQVTVCAHCGMAA